MKFITGSAFTIFYKYLCPIPFGITFNSVTWEFVTLTSTSHRLPVFLIHIIVCCEILFVNLNLINASKHSSYLEIPLGYNAFCVLLDLILLESLVCFISFLVKTAPSVSLVNCVRILNTKWSILGN